MIKPHKHAAQIRAWANGATIEYKSLNNKWLVSENPCWEFDNTYRVKLEPKPNVVTWHAIQTSIIHSSEYTKQDAADYPAVTAILRIEIDYNDLANPVLVSATLEKP